MQRIVHDHPYYPVNPDILSLVRDPLSGNECGSPNHTYILVIYFCLFANLLIGTSNKVSKIIRRHIDNRKLLLVCILLLSHSVIFFRFFL